MALNKMDIVDVNLNTGNIHRSFLSHTIGLSDNNADSFGVRVFRDGEPVDLSGGWVQGFFRNPMGENIALTNHGTISGNTAYVTLPQACYNYDGQFTLAIKIVSPGSTNTVTMRIVDGMVDNTNVGGAVAPTETVPTYQEILATYEDMLAATTAATTAATNVGSIVAAAYSTSATYAVGDYCTKDGNLYRCTTAITTAESWTAAHWTQTKMGPDVSDLKSALAHGTFTNNTQYYRGEYIFYGTKLYRFTKDYKGYWNPNYVEEIPLSDGVTDIADDLYEKIGYTEEYNELVTKNLLNLSDLEDGKQINYSTGAIQTNANWRTSDYEYVKPSQTYKCYNHADHDYQYSSVIWFAYDLDKNPIAGSGQQTTAATYYTTPANAYYIRVSILAMSYSDTSGLYITEDTGVYGKYQSYYNQYDEVQIVHEPEILDKKVVTSSISVTNKIPASATFSCSYGALNTYKGAEETTVDFTQMGGANYCRLDVEFTATNKHIYIVMARVKCLSLGSSTNANIACGKPSGSGDAYSVGSFFHPLYNNELVSNYRIMGTNLEANKWYTMASLFVASADGTAVLRISFNDTSSSSSKFVYKDYMLFDITDCYNASSIDLICNAPFVETTKTLSFSFIGQFESLFYNKRYASIGDSITAGVNSSQDSETKLKESYAYFIAKRNGMKYTNYGFGGRTFSVIPGQVQCFADELYKTIPYDEFDYVTILMGINDVGKTGYSLGTIDDETASTYYGAFNVVMSYILQENPVIKIGLICPYGTNQQQRQAVKDIAEKYGAIALDLYSEDVPMFYARDTMTETLTEIATARKAILMPDGTHPSGAGSEYLSTIVEDFMRRL